MYTFLIFTCILQFAYVITFATFQVVIELLKTNDVWKVTPCDWNVEGSA